jgi:hypothetical protein
MVEPGLLQHPGHLGEMQEIGRSVLSRTIHGARTCLDACRYYSALVLGALQGAPKEELLSPRYAPPGWAWETAPLDGAIDAIASGSFKDRQPPAIRGTGYVTAVFYRSSRGAWSHL